MSTTVAHGELQHQLTALLLEVNLTQDDIAELYAAFTDERLALAGGATLQAFRRIIAPHIPKKKSAEQQRYLSDAAVESWFNAIDSDLDGLVNWATFYTALRNVAALRRSPPQYKAEAEAVTWAPGAVEGVLWIHQWQRFAVFLSDSPHVFLYTASGALYHTLSGHTAPPITMCYVEGANRLVSSACDRTVIVWDAKRGLPQAQCVTDVPVSCLHYDDTQDKLFMALLSGQIAQVPLMLNAPPVVSNERHDDWIVSMASARDVRFLLTGSRDDTIGLWDPDTCERQHVLTGHVRSVVGLAYFEDSGVLFTAEQGGSEILQWNLFAPSAGVTQRLQGHDRDVMVVARDAFSGVLISADRGGSIAVWDPAEGTLLGKVTPSVVTAVRSTPVMMSYCPATQAVMQFHQRHYITATPKPRGVRPMILGESVTDILFDPELFLVVVVSTSVVYVVAGIDGRTVRSLEHPLGRHVPITACALAGNHVFLMNGAQLAYYNLLECTTVPVARRVATSSLDGPVAGVARTMHNGASAWFFIHDSSSVSVGRFDTQHREAVFQRVAGLTAPAPEQLRMRSTRSVVSVEFAAVNDELAHAVVKLREDAATLAAYNTRTVSRLLRVVEHRAPACDACYVPRRNGLVLLHGNESVAMYTLGSCVRVVEITGLAANLAAPIRSMRFMSGDSIALAVPGITSQFVAVSFTTALEQFMASTSAGSLEEVHDADGDAAAKSRNSGDIFFPGTQYVCCDAPAPRKRFASTLFFGVDPDTNVSVAIKAHALPAAHNAELKVFRELAAAGCGDAIVKLLDAWDHEPNHRSPSPKRRRGLPKPSQMKSVAELLAMPAGTDLAAAARSVEAPSTQTQDASGATVEANSPPPPTDDVPLRPERPAEEASAEACDAVLVSQGTGLLQRGVDDIASVKRGIVMERGGYRLRDAASDGVSSMADREDAVVAICRHAATIAAAGYCVVDLRPAAIVRVGAQWKFCGLGSFAPLGGPLLARPSPSYCPPELVRYMAPQTDSDVQAAADAAHMVWSLGCIAYELATNTALFRGRSDAAILKEVKASTTISIGRCGPVAAAQSKLLGLVTGMCIAVDPRDRCTLGALVAAIEDALKPPEPAPYPVPSKTTSVASLRRSVRDASAGDESSSVAAASVATLPRAFAARAVAAVTFNANATVAQRLGDKHLGAVTHVAPHPTAEVVACADITPSAATGGFVHLFDVTRGATCGTAPVADVGIARAEDAWSAPLGRLSVEARRGIVASGVVDGAKASKSSAGGSATATASAPAKRSSDEAQQAAGFAVVAPLLSDGEAEAMLLRDWERLSHDEIKARVAALEADKVDKSILDVMNDFKAQIAGRSHFYEDTGAKRRPGEAMELYAPQPRLRMTALDYSLVHASKEEAIARRNKARLSKLLADPDAKRRGALPPLSSDFVRSVPALVGDAEESKAAADRASLFRPVKVTAKPVVARDDPVLIIDRSRRTAYNVETKRRPSTDAYIDRSLQRARPGSRAFSRTESRVSRRSHTPGM